MIPNPRPINNKQFDDDCSKKNPVSFMSDYDYDYDYLLSDFS